MDERICATDDCSRPVRAVGLCGTCYARFRRRSGPPCSVSGCGAATQSRGLCNRHYLRWLHGGLRVDASLVYPQPPGDLCTIEGCERRRKARAMCSMHLSRFYRVGEPGEPDVRKVVGYPADLRCAESGCASLVHKRHLCRQHYRLALTAEQPLGWKWSSSWCMTVHEIAARDGTLCGICGEDVDLSLRNRDPLSPSVDHIVARSAGGADEPDNVRLVHLTCNIRKGTKAA